MKSLKMPFSRWKLTVLLPFVLSIANLSILASSCHASSMQFSYGYCTRYAAEQFDGAAPYPDCNWSGHAYTWFENAAAKGWQTTSNPSGAIPGSVIVWTGGGFGHVAIVNSVTSTTINISEMNWGPLSPPGNTMGKTTMWNVVSRATLPISNLNRANGTYRFRGFILPVRIGDPVIRFVTIQSMANGKFVCAEGGGGGPVYANRLAASIWETFALRDQNGGDLRNGDIVQIRVYNGQYWSAEGGGGDVVNANRSAMGGWEAFTVVCRSADGLVTPNVDVAFHPLNQSFYLCTELGQSERIVANRTTWGPWETFRIAVR